MNTKQPPAMLKFLKLNGLLCLLFCVSYLSSPAQNDLCLQFEDLPPQGVYGKDSGLSPGDLAFTENGVDVYVQEFIYSNSNEVGFWNASVTTDLFGPTPVLAGQWLFISNINLSFDFTKLEHPVNGLCFRVLDGGGEENIAVNGQPIQVLAEILDAPVEIAPGVTLSVNPIPNSGTTYPKAAEICLSGPIEQLTIGGQEFGFDHLCYFIEPCPLTELKAEIVNCDYVNDEVFVYDIALDFPLPATSPTVSFDVFVDGTFRGYYNASDLPLRLKQIRILNNKDVFAVNVCLNDRPDCCVSVELPNAGCPINCALEKIEISAIECSFDGHYYAKIQPVGSNLSEQITITNEFGVSWTGPSDGSEPVKFPIPDQQYDQWTVCDTQNPNCCYTFDFNVPCPPCRIGELRTKVTECTDDGMFFILLDFEHLTPTGQFNVLVNGEDYKAFAYSSLPVELGPFQADPTLPWHILVEDASQQCEKETKLEPVVCKPKDCQIGALEISGPACTDAPGQFFFKLNFDHQSTSEVFKLYLNGDLYEQFLYTQLPVTVGPLPADGTTKWHVLVEDLSGLCAEDINLPAVDCNPKECVIGDLLLSEPACTDDGQFFFRLNFKHENTSDKFQLLLNGDVYESYAYADLPITVGPLPANTDFDWQVLVRDLGNSNTTPCAADAKLPSVDCPGGECTIGALKLVDTYCTDDGQQFYTYLTFEHKHTSEKFQVYLQDQLYGTFAYSELPLKLGPFNALIDLEWKLLVKDAGGNCAADIAFSAPNCGGGECKLSDLIVERYPCIGGQFLVDLAFDIHDPGPEGYYVFANGQISGPHSYEQPYITIGPFAGDGSTVYDFLVIDIANPSCYGYYELGPVDCSNPCTISEVKAEARECNEDGGFLVDITFQYDKVGSSGFTIRGNGTDYGSFEYGQEVYTIGPIAGDGKTVYEFVVIDKDKPDCRAFTTLDPIDCLPCRIGELEYTVQCLNSSQQFILNLDFEHEYTDSERFTLAVGDQVIGNFFYSELPLSRELPLPSTGELVVAVWDSENQDCAQKAQFTIPCCYLSEPVVEAHPCENDGELWLDLDFKYYNVSDAFQLVYGPQGGTLVAETFHYGELPITLGPLPGQTAGDWYVEVTDLGFFCQSSTTFTTEYCDNDACAEWDQAPLGAYGPLTGYEPGEVITEEDGLRLSLAPSLPANCNCSVFITKATSFPAFSAASGQVILLDNSGVLLNAPGYEITSLTVDYYFLGTEVLLQANGAPAVTAAQPTALPENIAPGVQLKVEATSNDGRSGRMIFTGSIYRLSFLSRGRWVLDNFCTGKEEKEDEVWPGDTNLDNVANHVDLLNIGLAFGAQGPPRTDAAIIWEGQAATDWPDLFFDSDLNVKHADANGDGVVDRSDRAPIMEHYGLTHGPLPVFSDAPATENDPPLYVDFDALANPIPVGGTFEVPIVFGTELLPVADIYGLAFTITFDPTVIDPNSIEVIYPDSWLGDTEKDLITLDRTLAEAGRIDVALTRIDKVNVGGHGAIASLIGAIDDIAGKHTEVGITEVVAITASEVRVPVNGIATKVEFGEALKPEPGYIDLNASLNIFPNPTSGEVLITTRFNFPIERIRILDSYGNPTGIQNQGKNRINLDELPSGVYMLRIQLGEHTISRKVIKVN